MHSGPISARCPPSVTELQRSLREACIPGLVAIVVNPTGILYDQAVCYQSPEISPGRRAMNPSQSIFVLASISKTFIAVAVMQLVESKRLDMDVDINRYLSPDVIIRHPLHPNVPITLRHLLSHSAGFSFNLQENLAHSKPKDEFAQWTLADTVLKYLNNKSNWLPETPGSVTEYSNIGACLAALIVEGVANKSFEHYVRDAILKPLGIGENEAGYRIGDFETRKEDLVGHFVHDASWLKKHRSGNCRGAQKTIHSPVVGERFVQLAG